MQQRYEDLIQFLFIIYDSTYPEFLNGCVGIDLDLFRNVDNPLLFNSIRC